MMFLCLGHVTVCDVPLSVSRTVHEVRLSQTCREVCLIQTLVKVLLSVSWTVREVPLSQTSREVQTVRCLCPCLGLFEKCHCLRHMGGLSDSDCEVTLSMSRTVREVPLSQTCRT